MEDQFESLKEYMADTTAKILAAVYEQGKRIDKLEEAKL